MTSVEGFADSMRNVESFIETTQESDPALHTLIQDTLSFYRRVLAIFPPHEVCVSFNGGKDACAMLFLLLHALRTGDDASSPPQSDRDLLGDVALVHFDPSADFPEVSALLEQVAGALGVSLRVFPAMRAGVEVLVGEGRRLFFLGTRRGDPYTEDGASLQTSSASWPAFVRAHPLFEWSYRQVWAFLRGTGLPYCALYDKGYTSIGTRFDTVPNEALRAGEGFLPAYLLEDESLERSNRRPRQVTEEKKEGEEGETG